MLVLSALNLLGPELASESPQIPTLLIAMLLPVTPGMVECTVIGCAPVLRPKSDTAITSDVLFNMYSYAVKV
jgi:hypothetical protein